MFLQFFFLGSIFASMVKGVAAVQPDQTLQFFVPHLCTRFVIFHYFHYINIQKYKLVGSGKPANFYLLYNLSKIVTFGRLSSKIENVLKGSLDLIPSPSSSIKIQNMGGKVCLFLNVC